LKRLLVSDLDGTLLDESGRLPSEFEELMKLLTELGAGFVPASSRSPQNVSSLFADAGEIEWAICSDGATIIRLHPQGFEVHHEELLDSSAAVRSLEILLAAGVEVPILFTGAAAEFRVLVGSHAAGRCSLELADLLADGRPISFHSTAELRVAVREAGVRAVSAYGEMEALAAAAVPIVATPPPGASSYLYAETRLPTGSGWLDLFSERVGKEHAVRRLLADEDAELIAVLGNGVNDVATLALTPVSACPADSAAEARAVAGICSRAPGGGSFISEICKLLSSAADEGAFR
jgi:hydroxymethylpyrimidine pyrophosphatase-like HAD family hydrolase